MSGFSFAAEVKERIAALEEVYEELSSTFFDKEPRVCTHVSRNYLSLKHCKSQHKSSSLNHSNRLEGWDSSRDLSLCSISPVSNGISCHVHRHSQLKGFP